MWLLGHVRHDEHWSETGFLAGEAALNSLVAVETFKYSLRRERPYQGNGTGSFFFIFVSFFFRMVEPLFLTSTWPLRGLWRE